MTTAPTPSSEPQRPSQPALWRRLAMGVVRWAYRALGTVVILAAGLVLMSQTQWFRDRLRDVLVSVANDNLLATLQFTSIEIDIWNGLVIREPVLYANQTRLLSAKRISMFYELAPLTRRIVGVSSLRIVEPDVSLLRTKHDSVWNFERIVRPSADTTTTEPPDGTIVIRSLEIHKGSVLVNDMTSAWTDQQTFDPTHIRMTDVYLNASTRIALRERDISLAVNHFSYRNNEAPFDVRMCRLALRANERGIEIPLLHLDSRRSVVRMRAAAPGLHPFENFDLVTRPLYGVLEADEVDAADVRYFVPDVNIVGTYGLKANVRFSGTAVNVTSMLLTGSDVRLAGDVLVDHLDGSAPLHLDVRLRDSYARYAVVRSALHMVELPPLPFLARTAMSTLRMVGSPQDSLRFDIDGSDAPGAVKGTFMLHLGDELGYSADLVVGNLNLRPIVDDTALASSINGRIRAVGRGTTFPGLAATVNLDLDRTTVSSYTVQSFRLQSRVSPTGGIDIDTAVAVLGADGAYAEGVDRETRSDDVLTVAGTMNLADVKHPQYALRVSTRAVDVGAFLGEPSLPQRLTGRFDVQGTGFELDSLESSLSARITEFVLADRAMMPFQLSVQAQRPAPSERRLLVSAARRTFRDPFMQVEVDGTFALSDFVTTAKYGSQALIRMVRRELGHVVAHDDMASAIVDTTLPSMAATIAVKATDLSILNAFLGGIKIDGGVTAAAYVASSPALMRFDVDTLVMRTMAISSDSLSIDIAAADVFGALTVEDLDGSPRMTAMRLGLRSDTTIAVQGTIVQKPRVDVDITNGSGTVAVRAASGDLRIHADVAARFEAQQTLLRIDSLNIVVDSTRGLRWAAGGGGVVTMNRGVGAFENLQLRRPWAETITLNGWASPTMFRQFVVTVEKFNLADVATIANVQPDHALARLAGRMQTANIIVNGTWDEPVIDLAAEAAAVAYNGEVIGDQTISLRHKDRLVTGTAVVKASVLGATADALTIDVKSFPFDCAFAKIDDRLVHGRPIDISVNAQQLPLAAAEPFLPAVERVRGRVNAGVSVQGMAPDDITFGGRATFSKAQFVVSSTGLTYTANGVMRLEGERLVFDTLALRNAPADLRGGQAMARGEVRFKGFSVESMDFSLETSGFHVLNRGSQTRSPNVYGDLTIATRRKPLRFFGPIDEPRLEGDIIITAGDVIFPKERSTTKRRLGSFVRHVASDSLGTEYDGSVLDYVMGNSRSRRMRADSIYRSMMEETNDVVALPTPAVAVEAVEQSVRRIVGGFADILQYKLNVYFAGRFLLTMVLGPTELLVADIELADPQVPLSVGGTLGKGLELGGRLRVKQGTSSYKFFRSFDASGILDFARGEMTNPSLNLLAVYKDSRMVGDNRREDFRVEIIIRGTKEKPITDFRIFRNDEEVQGDSAKIRGDALSLILVGRTQDDLLQSTGQTSLASEVSTAASATATQILGDVLGGIGNVKTQVDLGADLNTSRISFSGEVFGGLQYRMSGNVGDVSGNNTFTLTLPLSLFADADALRYFILDFSRTINNQSANVTRQQRDWEFKVGMRLP